MDDLAITCDEVMESYKEETKTTPTNFYGKKSTCKTQNLYILLITITLFTGFDKISSKIKTFITISRHNELREVLC